MRFEIAILNSGDSFFRFYGHFVAPGSNFQMFGGGREDKKALLLCANRMRHALVKWP